MVCSLPGHRRRELETRGGSCQSLVSKLKTMNVCMKCILRNSKQRLQADLQTGFQSWKVCSSDILDTLPRFLECFGRNWHLVGRHQMIQSFWLRYVDCGHLGSWRMGRHAKYLDKQQSYEVTTTLGLDDKVISSFQVEISLFEFWYHLGVYLILYILYLSLIIIIQYNIDILYTCY